MDLHLENGKNTAIAAGMDPVARVDAAVAAMANGAVAPSDPRQDTACAEQLRSFDAVMALPDDDRLLARLLIRKVQQRVDGFGRVLRMAGAVEHGTDIVKLLGDPARLKAALVWETAQYDLVSRNRALVPSGKPKRKGRRLRESQLAKFRPGRHSDNDGFGLHAHVKKKGFVRWVARIQCRFLPSVEKLRKRGGRMCVVKEYPRKDFRLGRWPSVSLQEARDLSAQYYGLVQKGKDPRVELARATTTVNAAWEAALPKRARKAHWKGGMDGLTAAKHLGTFRKHIAPSLGERPVADVTPQEIVKLVEALVDADYADIPVAAMKSLNIVFDWALAEPLRSDNPSRAASKVVGDIEGYDGGIAWLPVDFAYDAYKLICAYGGPNPGKVGLARRAALRALVLTLKRPAEVLGFRWENINWETGLIRIPKEQMKGRLPKRGKSQQSAQPAGTAELAAPSLQDPRELDHYHEELMTDELREVLLEMKALGSGTGQVFQVEDNGVVCEVTKNHLQDIMRAITEELGTVGCPHGWRKTFRTFSVRLAAQEGSDTALINWLAKKVLTHQTDTPLDRKYNKERALEEKLGFQERWVTHLHTKPKRR